MKSLFASILALTTLFSVSSHAAEVPEDIHKNDFKWFQFNLIKAIDGKVPFGQERDVYLETEFGGRSGYFDVYGFIDVLDFLDTPKSDFHNSDNLFFKLSPRVSLDYLTKTDLAVGPVREWFIAAQMSVGEKAYFLQYIGIGTDLEIPWFGKMGANLMARYVKENFGAANEQTWDGYMFKTYWYKDFYTFAEKSALTYQGYIYYTFGANKIADSVDRSNSSLEWYNGLYWQTERYAVGYGLEIYQNNGLFKSGGVAGVTSGVAHFFNLTYKY